MLRAKQIRREILSVLAIVAIAVSCLFVFILWDRKRRTPAGDTTRRADAGAQAGTGPASPIEEFPGSAMRFCLRRRRLLIRALFAAYLLSVFLVCLIWPGGSAEPSSPWWLLPFTWPLSLFSMFIKCR